MIVNQIAETKAPVPSIIPLQAWVGTLAVTIGGIKHARGIHVQVRATAFAGTGSYNIAISAAPSPVGSNFLFSEAAYSTTVGSRSYIFYPGIGAAPPGSGHQQHDTILNETIIIYLRNSSAVPGNEVTAEMNVTLLP